MKKYLQFFRLLNKELKTRFFKLFLLTLFATFIESFSIGLFIPVISLISDENNSKIIIYYSKLGIDVSSYSYQSIVILTLLGLFITYLTKSIILSISSWKYSNFIFDIKKYISIQLFKKYLYADYERVIEKNSSESIRNIITETHLLVVDFLIPSIVMLTELIIVIGIMLLLLFINPLGIMLVSVTICSAIFIFHKTTKKLLKILGLERQYSEGKKIQVIQETIQGIKNVKIFGREKFFLNKFVEFTTLSSRTEAKQLTLAQLPRFWLEIIAIVALVILVIYSIGNHYDQASNKSLLSTIGLFAIAAFRILPSSNRILSSIQSIKYSSSVINLIIKELSTSIQSSSSKNVSPYNFKNKIQLKNVAFSYKKSNKLVLNNISFEIKKNQCLGIIGVSGTGKSTLIDLILGLIKIKKGSIKIDGKPINPNIDKWKNLVGYVPQNIFLLEDTIRNNILFGDSTINLAFLDDSIKFANLDTFVNSLPNGIETKIGEHGSNLSGGQLQRIGIARALYKKPEILILDEATSALDNKTEIEILSTIEKLKINTTVIIITHRKSSLRICDSIIKIHKGQILKVK